MLKQLNSISKWKYTIIIVSFIVVLIVLRLLWIMMFHHSGQPQAVNGQLDLRNWDAAQGRTISLDGQWEFYPHSWLIDKEPASGGNRSEPRLVQVPGSWDAALRPGDSTPYGYGSYRLRILLNPSRDFNYSIRVSSVRSSSALYVNGRLLAESGQTGTDRDGYTAENIPYTASFSSNGSSVIDIIVQASNFKDPRGSGIVRSIKFGTEAAVERETYLSASMQQMVAVVFLVHALYALILFLVGNRERRLLYFALLTLNAMFMNLLGSEEKLLHYWLPIDYDWSFKLVHLAMIGTAYALLQCVAHQLPPYWRKIDPWYAAVCAAMAILSLLLPARDIVTIQPFYFMMTGITFVYAVMTMLRTSIKEIKDNILLLMSLIAFSSSFVWWGIYIITGIKTVYYPFDLIISTACFASVWFRRYSRVHLETRKLAAKLQRADKLKDEFLANTSHELRNPLHGILNISQAVLERERDKLAEQSVNDLEIVLSIGRRMSLTLNDLLDVMGLKENVYRLQLRSFSIQTIANGVLDMLHFMTEGKSVKLINAIPEQFPQVMADENRVIQILFNLLHNAVKFTNEGEITVRGEVRDGKAFITVSDTGIGMDKETARNVFEPYEQAPPGKLIIEGGFGLGLSISKQLAELHGGTLKVHSVPGKGSEFVFTLQLAKQTEAREEPAPGKAAESIRLASLTAAAAAEPRLSFSVPQPPVAAADRPRILAVDDDPVNLKVIETILSTEKYDITTVTSGKKALEILDSQEWDLIISDVMMPLMSGYELTRKIRKRFTITELPVLLLTARSQTEDIENGFRAGANDYVVKPVDALEVRSRVRALTEVKQSVRDRLRMEAAWLQAQIQPHFLFNTLNAVSALSDIDINRMRKLLEVFSNFLSDKFKFQNMNELAPIEEELSIVRSYLYIEKVRFDDRLNVTWEIDECKQLKLPPLTIQPLVENAVRHGIMNRMEGGTVHIRISDYGTYAEITVADDGAGMDEAVLNQLLVKKSDNKTGIGLLNTDLRLKRHYGRGLQIISKPDHGTSVSFIVYKNNEGPKHSP